VTEFPVSDKLENYSHPKETENLQGQGAAEKLFLDNFNSGRFHHAWLITGAKGIGKASFAYRAAKFLLSGEGEGGLFGPPESLDVPADTPAISQVLAGSHPGLAVLNRHYDQKGKKFYSAIRVDDVRALSGFFRLTAADGSWRVVIIDPVDDMNNNAANAILKILEEPPERTVFFLLSHTPAGLLPTIRSRCRLLPLIPLSEADMRTVLGPHTETLSEAEMNMLLTLADGSPGKALQLMDAGGTAVFSNLLAIFTSYPRLNAEKLHALADQAGKKDGEGVYALICELYPWWLSRLVRNISTDFGASEIADNEIDIMKRLADAHSPDAWVDLWEKGNRLIEKAASVNLDRKQVVLNLFLNVERMGKR